MMILGAPVHWDELAGLHSDSIRLLADPVGIPSSHWPAIPPGQSAILAVGPEGGFTPLEKTTAAQLGWVAICLSPARYESRPPDLPVAQRIFAHNSGEVSTVHCPPDLS